MKKFNVFNTNNLWISLDAIKRIMDERSLDMEIIVNPKTLGKKNVPLPDNFEKLFLRGRLRALLIYIDISHWTLTTYKLQGTTKQTTFKYLTVFQLSCRLKLGCPNFALKKVSLQSET